MASSQLPTSGPISWSNIRATLVGGSGSVSLGPNRTFVGVGTSSPVSASDFRVTPTYSQTSKITFTSTRVGRDGPSLTQARNGLSGTGTGTWKNVPYFFTTTSGIQLWRVPKSGTYRIEAWGARGGSVFSFDPLFTGNRGRGARIRGNFNLTEGEVIQILVGQIGSMHTGGGGSFVVRAPYNTNASILVIAGGGGGNATSTNSNRNGTTSTSGRPGTGGDLQGSGGSNGNGGGNLPPGSDFGSDIVGGGGGFFTDGGGAGAQNFARGLAFVNGGRGGQFAGSGFIGSGGFGGGGGSRPGSQGGGGGGGYSGGGACLEFRELGDTERVPKSGGGGGSRNNGSSQSNSTGVNDGFGRVEITPL